MSVYVLSVHTCYKYIISFVNSVYLRTVTSLHTCNLFCIHYIQFVLSQSTCSNYKHSLYLHDVHKFQYVYMYYACVTRVYAHSVCLDEIHVYSSTHVFTDSAYFHTEINTFTHN